MNANGQPIPHRRLQAVNSANGEKAIPNPNSGLIWEFSNRGKKDEDQMHRTMSNVAIRNGLVIAPDLWGLVHCLDAKTGKRYWFYDAWAAILSSPQIVDDKVYVADEEGDVSIFRLSPDPKVAMKKVKGEFRPIAEITMDNQGWGTGITSPIFANGTLYMATRNKLFAIEAATLKK